jgi:hypothetical protein
VVLDVKLNIKALWLVDQQALITCGQGCGHCFDSWEIEGLDSDSMDTVSRYADLHDSDEIEKGGKITSV